MFNGPRALLLVTAALGCIFSLPLSAHHISSENDGDVYAFMPHFVFDTRRGVFLNGLRGRNYELIDCGSETDVCWSSSEFQFSFPRGCEARSAFFDRQSVGDNAATSVTLRRHHSSERLHLLFDPQYPSYAALVGQRGIAGVLYNPVTPLSEVVTAANLQRAIEGDAAGFSYGAILSAVRFGQCSD